MSVLFLKEKLKKKSSFKKTKRRKTMSEVSSRFSSNSRSLNSSRRVFQRIESSKVERSKSLSVVGLNSIEKFDENRSNVSMSSRASSSYVPQTQARFLCLIRTPNRPASKKSANEFMPRRAHPQFGRFLTYLRLQTLATRSRPNRINIDDSMMLLNSPKILSARSTTSLAVHLTNDGRPAFSRNENEDLNSSPLKTPRNSLVEENSTSFVDFRAKIRIPF